MEVNPWGASVGISLDVLSPTRRSPGNRGSLGAATDRQMSRQLHVVVRAFSRRGA